MTFDSSANSGSSPGLKRMRRQSLLSRIICMTPLQYLPVHVRHGLAAGARWTFLPYSFYWRSGGESHVIEALEMLGNVEGASCWDFGAHFGIYTVGMAMLAGKNGQVTAFEPNPASFRRLRLHVRMNRLSNVRIFNLGVSDQDSAGDLVLADGRCSVRSHFQMEGEKVGINEPRVHVHTVRPDVLVERDEIRPPDLIKVDVQGYGGKVLKGSRISIEKKRPLILFSSHSRRELDGAGEILRPMGYEVFDGRGNEVGWSSFKSPWDQTAILRVPGK
jgi:FkbM family methyltransferase